MSEVDINKAYYAVIPANVRYDRDLPPNAKLLYGEITALANEKGYCWASNGYFAQLYGVDKKTVSKWVGLLEAKGYVYRHMEHKTGNKELKERRIFIHYPIHEKKEGYRQKNGHPIHEKVEGYRQKNGYPIHEKVEDNNTSNNTINILDDDDMYAREIPLSQKGISEAPVLPFWDNTKCDNTFRAQLNNISIKENKELNVLDDDDMYARELAEIENEFKKYYSKKITPIIRKTLKELLELANKDLLLYSIGKLQDVDKPIAYLKAIIKNYLQNDIQTVAQAKVFDDKYKGKSKRKSKGKIDTIVPSSDVTVPSHFYYDWMNDLEEEKEKDYQSQTQNL